MGCLFSKKSVITMHQEEDTQKESKAIRRHLEATCMVLVVAIVPRYIEAIQPVAGAQHHRRHY